MIDVLEEFRSKTPDVLRELSRNDALKPLPEAQQALLDAAAEIEGGEQAYAALLSNVRELREKLARAEANLRATLALVPSTAH